MAYRRRPEDLSRTESEAGIIATLIHHPEYSFHSEYLLPEHFSNEHNRLMYSCLSGMAKDQIKTVDTYGIQEWIKKNNTPNSDLISKEEIDEIITMSSVLSRNSIKDYKVLVSNVWDVAFRREMLSRLDECRSLLADISQEDVRKRIYGIIDSVITTYSYGDEIEHYTDKIDSLWSEIEERQENGYSGIPFKFPTLNEYVTIEQGELVIFGAQQKRGKSIMLLNCAMDLLDRGYSVLYIDSELSDRLFTARLLAYKTGISYKDLTSGRYTDEDMELIVNALAWIKSKKFQHIYMPFFDSDNIYTTVKQWNHIQPIDVLIVDYFKSTGKDSDAFQTYAQMGQCVDTVKNEIAGNMNIAAIGAAQATATNKLADSAKIARNASTIIMIVDKEQDEIIDNGKECGNKKLIVTVNRNGAQHSQGEWIDVYFNGDHVRFEEATQHEQTTPY